MRCLTFAILLHLSVRLFSKDDILKLGKVSQNEIDLKTCSFDSTAGAVVLNDIGVVEFKYYNSKSRFEYTFTRRTRIKILNSNQKDQANQEIYLYYDKENGEGLGKIKASTYNVVNGKLVEKEMGKDAIYNEKFNNKFKIVRFTLPNVEVGSIIDFEYVISSPYINSLPSWKFQREIPTLKSTFNVEIPEYYTYRIISKGYLPIPDPKYDYRNVTEYISERVLQLDGTSKLYEGEMTFNYNITTWETSDIPAITDEPYVSCLDNYTSQISHEIARKKFPNSPEVNFTISWLDLVDKLLKHDNIGVQLSQNSGYLNDAFQSITKSAGTKKEKLEKAYMHMQQKMTWNQVNSKYVDFKLKDAYKDAKGNCSEINLNLIRLLKDLEIEAYPVILSTRSNGFTPQFPTEEGFNYLIALAKIDGQSLLLDATMKNVPPGTLPVRCLNGKGLVLKERSTEWVDLLPPTGLNIVSSVDAKMDEQGLLHGKLSISKKGYASINLRQEIINDNDKIKYVQNLVKETSGLKIVSSNFLNIDSIYLPTKELYEFNLENSTDKNSSLIFFSPIIFDKLKENPFKLEDRSFPVEYPYPVDITSINNIEIPKGYKIDEKPQSISLSLPENAGKFTYMINIVNDNNIQVTYKFNIKKTMFAGEDYIYLREFYTQFLKKLNEQVIIKKV